MSLMQYEVVIRSHAVLHVALTFSVCEVIWRALTVRVH